MRAVLDTNVLISALVRGRKPRRLLKALSGGIHSVIVSEAIVEEFLGMSDDERIQRNVVDEDASAFMGALLTRAVFMRPTPVVKVFDDPGDEILATAKEGHAEAVLTGDRHMLRSKRFGRPEIISVDEALSMLKKQSRLAPARRRRTCSKR